MKYGIVSTASIVKRFIKAINHTDSEIAAIYSRSIAKAMNYAKEYGIKEAYDDMGAFLNSNIDVVYIATVNKDHYKWIKASLLHGKHVLCEKPLVLKSSEVNELFDLASEHGLLLMEATKTVFLPITNKLKEIIQEKNYGKLLEVDMASSWANPVSWMYESQGGVLNGSGTYTYEYLKYLLEPKKIEYRVSGNVSGECVSKTIIKMRMDDVKISSSISMEGLDLNRAIFYFEKAKIEVPNSHRANKMIISQETSEVYQIPCDYELIYEIEHFEKILGAALKESPIMNRNMSYSCAKFVEDANMKIFSENNIH